MATAYIAEFQGLGNGNNDTPQAVAVPPVAEQTVAIGAAVSSAVFNAKTTLVRIHVDAICSIAFGPTPVAAITNMRLAANQTEYFRITPGDKVSVIANT